jgi:hypothetical protein
MDIQKSRRGRFTNTRVMKTKWIIKIERRDNSLFGNLLRNKYLGEAGIFSYKKKNGSQFWKGLMLVREDAVRVLIYCGEWKENKILARHLAW